MAKNLRKTAEKAKEIVREEKAEEIVREIEIPEGIEMAIDGRFIILKKDSNELRRKVAYGIELFKEGGKIVLKAGRNRLSEKKNIGTSAGHIKNMINGLTKGFEYELEICNIHFPMNVEFNKAKKEIVIKNLLGEKFPRVLTVPDNVVVEINAPKIILKSYDIEAAGQVASKLERVSRIRNRDRNKFQDGIFITKKPGKEYL